MSNVSWGMNPQILAQVGHFFGAYTAIFTTAVFFGRTPMIVAMIIGLAIAGVKEFWYDLVYETPKQTILDSVEDFAFYALGGFVGAGLALLAEHFGKIS